MTNTLKRLSGLACTAALLAFTGLASAQRPQDQNNGNGGHFRDTDRGHLQQHYQADAHKWAGRHDRPSFEAGRAIPRNYHVQPVPSSYWQGDAPPPGYSYGYYDGYVVSYNPTTRIVADGLDLATGH